MCPPLLAAIPFAASMGSALGTSAAAGGLMIASLAASGAAAGMSFMGQKQATDNANAYQKYQYEETQRLATDNLMNQYRQIGLRQVEESAAFSQQVTSVQNESIQALSQAAVRSGESGVYGNSVDALMMDFRKQQTESVGNLELNYAMRGRQIQAQALGLQGQAESQINRTVPQYQMTPSIISPILQTAGAGFGMAANLAGPNFFRSDQTTPSSNPYTGRSEFARNDTMGAYSKYTSRFRNPYFGGA